MKPYKNSRQFCYCSYCLRSLSESVFVFLLLSFAFTQETFEIGPYTGQSTAYTQQHTGHNNPVAKGVSVFQPDTDCYHQKHRRNHGNRQLADEPQIFPRTWIIVIHSIIPPVLIQKYYTAFLIQISIIQLNKYRCFNRYYFIVFTKKFAFTPKTFNACYKINLYLSACLTVIFTFSYN